MKSRLDRDDPLAELRNQFILPDAKIYLDGNSLGALPVGVSQRVSQLVTEEWGQDLIASWNRHDWIDLPTRVGEKIAPLVGAAPGQLICTDSVSVNLFKLLCSALALRPKRNVVLSQRDNFPTDLYTAQGLAQLLGPDRCQLRMVAADDLETALGDEVAVLMLTEVNFRDGHRHDIQALTAKAHARGVLVLWDLAHSAGVLPLELDRWRVDMAVGCGYKFLNGGPGAPAFIYLATRHHNQVMQPLCGWMGHRQAFAFEPGYNPADGVLRYLAGTPGVLGMSALEEALRIFDSVEISVLHQKSLALGEHFMAGVDSTPELAPLSVVTPREPARRGSHISLAHPNAYGIAQALIEHGVIVDFRAPDIVRFGFSPMYNRFQDIATALAALADIMRDKRYLQPKFQLRTRVT